MIFQIYDLLAPPVAKASTVRYGAGKAESRNLNMRNCLHTQSQATEDAVISSLVWRTTPPTPPQYLPAAQPHLQARKA